MPAKRSAATQPILGVGAVLELHQALALLFQQRPSELVRTCLCSRRRNVDLFKRPRWEWDRTSRMNARPLWRMSAIGVKTALLSRVSQLNGFARGECRLLLGLAQNLPTKRGLALALIGGAAPQGGTRRQLTVSSGSIVVQKTKCIRYVCPVWGAAPGAIRTRQYYGSATV